MRSSACGAPSAKAETTARTTMQSDFGSSCGAAFRASTRRSSPKRLSLASRASVTPSVYRNIESPGASLSFLALYSMPSMNASTGPDFILANVPFGRSTGGL